MLRETKTDPFNPVSPFLACLRETTCRPIPIRAAAAPGSIGKITANDPKKATEHLRAFFVFGDLARGGNEMKKLLLMLACLAYLPLAIGPLWAAGDLKVPETNIVKPGPDIPEDIRAFSGKWNGRWTSWQCPPSHGWGYFFTSFFLL